MNWQQIEGKWDQLKGDVKTKWGKLTDDDMQAMGGKKDTLVGKIVERYGVLKEEAETQVDEWLHKFDMKTDQMRDDKNAMQAKQSQEKAQTPKH